MTLNHGLMRNLKIRKIHLLLLLQLSNCSFIFKFYFIYFEEKIHYTKEDADAYLNILKSVLEKKNVLNKPDNIYNVDETRLSLNK